MPSIEILIKISDNVMIEYDQMYMYNSIKIQ